MVIGARCAIDGEVESQDDLVIQGHVTGIVWCEAHAVVVERHAVVTGNIIARHITVRGRVEGDLIGTHGVEIRASARVTGRVLSRSLVLEEGGWFVGAVQPQQLTAALEVARYSRGATPGELAATP